LDSLFDGLFAGRGWNSGLFEDTLNTIEDRIRLPWPGGAKKVQVELIPAPFIVFLTIRMGSYGIWWASFWQQKSPI